MFDNLDQVFDNNGVTVAAVVSRPWDESGVLRDVHPALRPLFPGGLKPDIYALTGAASVGFGLLAGGWCGVAGLPNIGVEAAREWGVDLSRLVVIPAVEPWLETVATLIDGLDVLLVAAPRTIAPAAAQRLKARLRSRGCTLVVVGSWPRTYATIDARTVGWQGLGRGHGFLERQELEVSATHRAGVRTVRIVRSADGVATSR